MKEGLGEEGGVRESIVVETETDIAVDATKVAWGAVVAVTAVANRHLKGIMVLY